MHTKDRSEYLNIHAINRDKKKCCASLLDVDALQCTLESAESTFTYRNNGLFCGHPDINEGQRVEYKLILVRTSTRIPIIRRVVV